MSPQEKREYVLSQYGPGKKHDNHIALNICYHDLKLLNQIVSAANNQKKVKPIKLEYHIAFDNWMPLRFNKVDRLVISCQNKWYHCTLQNKQAFVRCKREEKKYGDDTFRYTVIFYINKMEVMKDNPFSDKSFQRINSASVEGKEYTVYIQLRETIKQIKKKDTHEYSCARLLINVDQCQFKKIQDSTVLTLSGKIICAVKQSVNRINKFYCICKDNNKILEADIADSTVLTANNGYCYKVKIHNCRVLNKQYLRLDDNALIVSSIDDNGYKVNIYK